MPPNANDVPCHLKTHAHSGHAKMQTTDGCLENLNSE